MLPIIVISTSLLLLLQFKLLLIFAENDGIFAFHQIRPTPSPSLWSPQQHQHQRRHLMRNNHHQYNNNNCVQENRWILYRDSLSLKLFEKDDSDDNVAWGSSCDMKDEFIGHQRLPLLQNKFSIDNFIRTRVSSSLSTDRRNTLRKLSQMAMLTVSTSTILSSPVCNYPTVANAATLTTTAAAATNAIQLQSSTSMSNNKSNMNYISADTAKITHKVFFNVRISRPDGTFYVRDEDESMIEPENRVYYGQLIFGLFGNNAPNHVRRFLEYIIDPSTSASLTINNDEAPYPSYSRSSFTQFDDATGLLYGGTIPSMEVVEIQQSVALRYGNRLLPAQLWTEDPSVGIPNKISHDRIGLLTHEQFDATPVFGITTRNDTTALNPTHTVFGALTMNSDARDFLHRISTIPTYSIDRPIVQPQSAPTPFIDENGHTVTTSPSIFVEPDTVMSTMKPATDAIYNIQREFFRNTAKTLGDTRINKLYNGKLLRRVEVTQVGLL